MERVRPGVSGQGNGGSSNACLPCRKVKMKCRLEDNPSQCARCRRIGLECLFLQHRRGRKRRATSRSPTPERPSTRPRVSEFEEQPLSPLASERATPKAFSLETVLSTERDAGRSRLREPCLTSSDDPICKGLLNQAVAENLFESFMNHLNPFISQLDPGLHTFSYVRGKSPFLLTAILAAAGKAFNPATHVSLRQHAEYLFAQTFIRGEGSPETIQAILILTYWKQPDDTRAFVNVGLAIRIAIDLGWHTLAVQSGQDLTEATELERRQIRNIQRTWLVLFVYDQSISMQTGKPSMIEAGDFIESVREWYRSPLAISNDGLLCAFVELRLMTYNVFDILQRHTDIDSASGTSSHRPLRNNLFRKIQRWKDQWSKELDIESHPFLIHFYGNHLLFTIFSTPFPTQLLRMSQISDLGDLWKSQQAAINMLGFVRDQTTSSTLYFMQDSLHVMIAHTTIFLTKLLFSISRSVRDEIEPATLSAVRSAQQAFTLQAAPPDSGCGMQAKFLDNVVSLLMKLGRTNEDDLSSVQREAGESDAHNSKTRPRKDSDLITQQESAPATCRVDVGPHSDATVDLSFPAEEPQVYNFFDDEMWSTMFASAGFDIHDDAFLLETTP